jgi:hypothetical protein
MQIILIYSLNQFIAEDAPSLTPDVEPSAQKPRWRCKVKLIS